MSVNDIDRLNEENTAYAETITELKQQLAEREKQIVILTKSLHMIISPKPDRSVTLNDVLIAHSEIATEALAATQDLSAIDKELGK
jgi:hypothetical protein